MKNNYQGLQKKIQKLELPELETVENNYSSRGYNIHIEFPEFTCVCPKTGLPDFANIIIDYIPKKKIIELKSLKFYFIAYRNLGIFHENVVNKILDDLVAACQPTSMKITGEFSPRGGIKTTVTAELPSN